MEISKYIAHNQPNNIEEILYLMLNQSHVESKSINHKEMYDKVWSEIKTTVGTVGVFGSGITSFYPIFDNLIKNGSIEITTESLVMMSICSICIVYMDEADAKIENIDKLKKWIKSCLEECRLNGTYGLMKKMVEVVKSVRDLFSFILKKCGKVVNTLTNMFSYSSFFVPFAIAVSQLISKHSVDVDLLPNMFASLSLGTFTITAKHYLMDLISKLNLKFKKDPLSDTQVVPDKIDKFSEWEEKEMINETDFKITEKHGVALPTIQYNNIILPKVLDIFQKFMSRRSDRFDQHYIFGKNTLSISDEEFKEFPVSRISLNITFERFKEKDFVTKYPGLAKNENKNYFCTGLCYSIGEENGSALLKDKTISLKMAVGAKIRKDVFTKNDIEKLEMEISSSILHELNHAYEGWKRFQKNKPHIPTALTWALDNNSMDVPHKVWDTWEREIGFYVYWTEKHEMNAMIQDTQPYTKRYDVEEMKTISPSWIFANRMKTFNASKFKKEMVGLIEEHMPGQDPEEILNGMKKGLSDKLEELMKDQKEIKSSISPSLIRRMSIDQFLKYCEDRIHKGSDNIKRRILKQYSK